MSIMEWYAATVAGDTANAVALRAGLVQSTLARQIKAGQLSPEVVVAIARAYRADVLDALVTAGTITREDIRRHGVALTLRDALGIEIAAEVARRLDSAQDVAIFDAPLS